ncbi:methylated-DNA--[protein]-cysteine S-methyltransferase [Archaeoglobus veneficus]|uniref:methylated-DNA--[protein]-cysteine S-methyltransferase n=1 Tax=Archaeoglobus veneficus (strain DSM 11195 / SNP6) TaxID=693661 RepID=F2KS56_ARCVS|nr:methylated-DNA--[protein]-cysteine S-methyltransferase [Archaeoglobus veneficus]AEA47995.1 Methylated-DNA--protein-cysteinemethyltransferase [Archaeoglobus veneficus SNP6]
MSERFSIRWAYFVNVEVENGVVKSVSFSDEPIEEDIRTNFARKLKRDVERYLSGQPVDFSAYPVAVHGFTARVLEEVRKVGFGETTTYGEIARKLSTSPRAVGQALKRNPAPIIIPCHRVVAKSGIGGYSSGEKIKRMLLELEGVKLP